MPKIDVYDINGKKVKELELNESIFGIEPNEEVVHSVLINFLANQRQGTQSTKTRAEVSGGGRKPWRQKGTGRARQGSIRAPQWIKGGIALGPKPRSYRYTVNKKEKRLAIISVLSSKVLENKLTVVDKLELAEIKTKSMVNALNNLKVDAVKIHMLHILKGTEIEKLYNKEKFHILTKEEYIDIVINQLELLDEKIVIERITGDPIKDDLIAPLWLKKKFCLLNDIDKEMVKRDTYQGKKNNN